MRIKILCLTLLLSLNLTACSKNTSTKDNVSKADKIQNAFRDDYIEETNKIDRRKEEANDFALRVRPKVKEHFKSKIPTAKDGDLIDKGKNLLFIKLSNNTNDVVYGAFMVGEYGEDVVVSCEERMIVNVNLIKDNKWKFEDSEFKRLIEVLELKELDYERINSLIVKSLDSGEEEFETDFGSIKIKHLIDKKNNDSILVEFRFTKWR